MRPTHLLSSCRLRCSAFSPAPAGWRPRSKATEGTNGGSERRGIARYIRKKKLDPLDTYVPAVVAARKQLKRAGEIMRDDLQGARDLLREGAFDGLRDNIRALGEYAEKGGIKDAKKLVDGFFSASQAFDYTLFQAKRREQPVGKESDEKLAGAIAALDRLLATVPADILEQSEKIVAAVEEIYSQPLALPGEDQPAGPAEQQQQEQQPPAPNRKLDELIQLVPG